jgi:hypothetical protein
MITENILIATFRTHFGAPEVDDMERFFDGYIRQLDRLSTGELTAVADHVLRTHKTRQWPTVGAVMDAVNATRDTAAAKFDPPNPEFTKALRLKAAKQMILCDVGIQAAHEGWAEELYEFCSKRSRLPVGPERLDLRRYADAFEARNHDLAQTSSGRTALEGMRTRRTKRAETIFEWAATRQQAAA